MSSLVGSLKKAGSTLLEEGGEAIESGTATAIEAGSKQLNEEIREEVGGGGGKAGTTSTDKKSQPDNKKESLSLPNYFNKVSQAMGGQATKGSLNQKAFQVGSVSITVKESILIIAGLLVAVLVTNFL